MGLDASPLTRLVDEESGTSGPDFDLKGAVCFLGYDILFARTGGYALTSDITCLLLMIAPWPIRMEITNCERPKIHSARPFVLLYPPEAEVLLASAIVIDAWARIQESPMRRKSYFAFWRSSAGPSR